MRGCISSCLASKFTTACPFIFIRNCYFIQSQILWCSSVNCLYCLLFLVICTVHFVSFLFCFSPCFVGWSSSMGCWELCCCSEIPIWSSHGTGLWLHNLMLFSPISLFTLPIYLCNQQKIILRNFNAAGFICFWSYHICNWFPSIQRSCWTFRPWFCIYRQKCCISH